MDEGKVVEAITYTCNRAQTTSAKQTFSKVCQMFLLMS